MGDSAKLFYLRTTPDDYFFAIWSFIYLGVAITIYVSCVYNKWDPSTHYAFILSNIINFLWVYAFTRNTVVSVSLGALAAFFLIIVVFAVWYTLYDERQYDF